MKNIFIVFVSIIISRHTFASLAKANRLFTQDSFTDQQQVQMIKYLYNKRLYFSAAYFSRRYLLHAQDYSQDMEKILEKLILQTGTVAYVDLPESTLRKWPSPTLKFILALKYFSQKKYRQVIDVTKNYKEYGRFSPEVFLTYASSLQLLNQYNKANRIYQKCSHTSYQFKEKAKQEKLKRYYTIINESCTIHQARMLYKRGLFAQAQQAYAQIPTKSYRWPYIILEQAWSAYGTEDYNRSLGLLVTYKSPLLKSYFMPEAAVLRALNYFNLCLYNDSLHVINEYYKTYKSQSDALKKIILPHKKSHTYFINLVNSDIKKNDTLNPFIRNLATQTKKTIKYNVEMINYKNLNIERKRIKKFYKQKKSKLLLFLHRRLSKEKKWRVKKLNYYVKKEMFRFLNEMHRFSYEMVNIKLDILFKKRDLIYKNQSTHSKRLRGSLDHVKREANQHFYTFKGAFWADELGDYSFGLKSQCLGDQKRGDHD